MTHHVHNTPNHVDTFTRGMSSGIRLFAKHLDQAMKDAVARGDQGIRSTLKELAEDAGLSYATAKRAKALFQEKGWITEGPRRCLVPRWPVAHLQEAHLEPRWDRNDPQRAQSEPVYKEVKKSLHAYAHDIHLQSHNTQGVAQSPKVDRKQGHVLETGPAGELAIVLGPEHQQAVTLLIEAGMEYPGARSAVIKLKAEDRFDLKRIRKIIIAFKSKEHRLRNPGGFLYLAITNKEIGDQLLKEFNQHSCRSKQTTTSRIEEQTIPTQPRVENSKLRCLNKIASSIENHEDLLHAINKINIPLELLKEFINTEPSLRHLQEFLNETPASMK